MSKKSSTVFTVSIMIVATGLLAGFLWCKRKNTGYSNIYTNQKYGFQISVPKEYIFKPFEMSDADIFMQFKTNDAEWKTKTHEPDYTVFNVEIWDKNLYDKEAEKNYGLNSNNIPCCVALGQNDLYAIEACFPNSGPPKDLETFINSLCCSSENVRKAIYLKFLNN